MLLITQGAATQQLNRRWSEIQKAFDNAQALVIDEGHLGLGCGGLGLWGLAA